MLLSEPQSTGYDLNFSLFGFPVRIHPAFFILPVFWGASTGDATSIIIFALIFLISVMIHEMGHAFVMRYFGQDARIVLYWMGGLAIPDTGGSWGVSRGRSFTSQQQILVSLAGPVAGFLLAVVFALIILMANGMIDAHFYGIFPIFPVDWSDSAIDDNPYLQRFLFFGLVINVYLNLLNLVPVYPLDGGQIARQIFIQQDPWNGVRNSLWLGVAAGGIIALFGLAHDARFLAIFFGFMAVSNYLSIQQMGGGGFGGGRRW